MKKIQTDSQKTLLLKQSGSHLDVIFLVLLKLFIYFGGKILFSINTLYTILAKAALLCKPLLVMITKLAKGTKEAS